jgi:spore germination protein GerM
VKRLALLCALLVLASCGTSHLVLLSTKSLPSDLYAAGESARPRDTAVTLYMVEGTRLAAVQRTGRSALALPQLVMSELLRGPTRAELTKGLVTQIPDSVRMLDISVDRGIASVDLSHDFELVTNDRTTFLLRLAQVVWTLTELDSVDSVRFLVEGQPVQVMVQDATFVSAPVAKGSYSQFAPRSLGAPVSVAPIGGG